MDFRIKEILDESMQLLQSMRGKARMYQNSKIKRSKIEEEGNLGRNPSSRSLRTMSQNEDNFQKGPKEVEH